VRRDLTRLAAVALIAIAIVGAYASYRVWEQGQHDERRPAAAIVVMGAAQYDGRPSKVFAARLDHAARLFEAGLAPRLIVTGGKADGDRTTEAASAKAYLIAQGVPDEAILMEDGSRSTLQSVRAVGAVMRSNGLGDAVFVSDRPHMLRVLRMASDAGIEAWGSPTGTSPIEGDPVGWADATVHELGALATYFLFGGAS
jgi:uncharacterized SAM-binding protein YcdF (DUF218 family)